MSSRETGGALAHRGVITEFMSEMDGLRSNSQDKRVIVIGATNRPFDLDDAVLRRLPRRLLVDLPGEKERKEILKILLREEDVAADVDLDEMAKRTGDFSGSDLKRMFPPFLRMDCDRRALAPDRSMCCSCPGCSQGGCDIAMGDHQAADGRYSCRYFFHR